MGSPMVIHFYGNDNDVLKTFSRSFVPWKLLKEAVKISHSMSHVLENTSEMTEEDVNSLAGLVVAVFGDQFSIEELNDQADVGEMVAVLNQIVTTASGGMTNPTPPGPEKG